MQITFCRSTLYRPLCARAHIWHVKKVLGHKSITNTEIYIHIAKAKFKETNDEFIVKAVDNIDEAKKLIEVGFEYVMELDGYKLLRKRK